MFVLKAAVFKNKNIQIKDGEFTNDESHTSNQRVFCFLN